MDSRTKTALIVPESVYLNSALALMSQGGAGMICASFYSLFKGPTMKKFLLITCFAFTASLLAGCHTVHGFGQDVEKLGGKIAEKSDKK